MTRERWLIDTGPLVAYVDSADGAHEVVTAALNGFKGACANSDEWLRQNYAAVSVETARWDTWLGGGNRKTLSPSRNNS